MTAGPAGTDTTGAAAQAARDVLVATYPSFQVSFDTAPTTQLAATPDSPSKAAGIAYGSSAANHIITLRSSDGSNAPVSYTASSIPGRWMPTGALTTPLFQQYAHVTPWAMSSST